MYTITQYTKNKAKKYGVNVKRSSNPLKKIDIFKNGIKIASIGGVRKNGVPYMDYPTYIKTDGLASANLKRKAYLARHAHEPKFKIVEMLDMKVSGSQKLSVASQTTRKVKFPTPSWWADKLLW
jgi:hypothetical protein